MHDPNDLGAILAWIQAQAAAENVRITQHAQQEMAEEDITLDDVLEFYHEWAGHRKLSRP